MHTVELLFQQTKMSFFYYAAGMKTIVGRTGSTARAERSETTRS